MCRRRGRARRSERRRGTGSGPGEGPRAEAATRGRREAMLDNSPLSSIVTAKMPRRGIGPRRGTPPGYAFALDATANRVAAPRATIRVLYRRPRRATARPVCRGRVPRPGPLPHTRHAKSRLRRERLPRRSSRTNFAIESSRIQSRSAPPPSREEVGSVKSGFFSFSSAAQPRHRPDSAVFSARRQNTLRADACKTRLTVRQQVTTTSTASFWPQLMTHASSIEMALLDGCRVSRQQGQPATGLAGNRVSGQHGVSRQHMVSRQHRVSRPVRAES